MPLLVISKEHILTQIVNITTNVTLNSLCSDWSTIRWDYSQGNGGVESAFNSTMGRYFL